MLYNLASLFGDSNHFLKSLITKKQIEKPIVSPKPSKILIDKNIKLLRKKNPLDYAIDNNDINAIKMLIEDGFVIEGKAVWRAMKLGYFEIGNELALIDVDVV